MPAPTFLSIDLETRSTIDLRKTGVYPYAAHPTTDVWCAAYAFDHGPVRVWYAGQPLPVDLRAALLDPCVIIRAWNAQFERILMRDVLTPRNGWPSVPLERFLCTMAIGRTAGLPGSLEEAAIALGLAQQKDLAGARLMMQMAKPRGIDRHGRPIWWDDEERLERLGRYCAQDVEVERAIWTHLPAGAMPRTERRVWLADQRINDRGVKLDLPRIAAAQEIAEREQTRLNRAMRLATGGEIRTASQVTALVRWVNRHLETPVESLDKDALGALLEQEIPDGLRAVLEIRREAAKSSTAKLKTMMEAAGQGDRVRGLLQYYGAGTGRWAGRLVQPQNFPRGTIKIDREILDAIDTRRPEMLQRWGEPLEVIASALRAMLVAGHGKTFYVADYAQIEARVVAWLAGQTDLLALFAAGGKVYETMAATIFGVPVEEVTPDQRQVGKMAILGLGFQMGAKRFAEQAKVDPELAALAVQVYRAQNHRIKALWWNLQAAALEVVTRRITTPLEVPGTGGKLTFRLQDRWLVMGLPSGRALWYYGPSIVMREVPWSEELQPAVQVWAVNGYTRKWEQATMYGGLWTENATQAVARDLMAEAILRLEEAGFPVVLTIHDEVIAEAPPTESVETFVSLLSATPAWAAGCPVKAEGWAGPRYRK